MYPPIIVEDLGDSSTIIEEGSLWEKVVPFLLCKRRMDETNVNVALRKRKTAIKRVNVTNNLLLNISFTIDFFHSYVSYIQRGC